ncbi:MAG TPA: hypothetical protein PLE43_06490 [Alphaproteobacteria bacterium]|nr:hypothetical protein [Alphaproteobacteria bacterium]
MHNRQFFPQFQNNPVNLIDKTRKLLAKPDSSAMVNAKDLSSISLTSP